MRRGCVWLAGCGLLAACATAPVEHSKPEQKPEPVVVTAAPEPAVQRGGLLFEVEPKEAELFIGSNSVGRVCDLAASGSFLKLDPGIYQLSIKLAGYATWRAEVTVREGQAEKIQVTMVAK